LTGGATYIWQQAAIKLGIGPHSSLRTTTFAFSALTLSAGHQEEHPACKNLSDKMLAWLCQERGANDLHMIATATALSSVSLKSRLVFKVLVLA